LVFISKKFKVLTISKGQQCPTIRFSSYKNVFVFRDFFANQQQQQQQPQQVQARQQQGFNPGQQQQGDAPQRTK
jgi:hypothetical protein